MGVPGRPSNDREETRIMRRLPALSILLTSAVAASGCLYEREVVDADPRVWGPAWVNWRYGAGYVTWSPLGPPGVVFGYRHPAWVAVPEQHFTRPIATVAIPGQRTYGAVAQANPLSGPHATFGRGGSFGP